MKRILFLLGLFLSACSPARSQEALISTIVARTLTAISSPSPTPPSSVTPTPTEIPYDLYACVKGASSLHIRSGPGVEFDSVGYLLEGDCVTIIGRDPDASWARMNLGWVSTSYLRTDGNFHKLRDLTATETPTIAFAPLIIETLATAIPTPTLTPTPDLRVVQGAPHEFLLKLDDLPDPYYLSNPDAIKPYTNAEILQVRGVREGKAYLSATGRLGGWFAWYKAGAQAMEGAPGEIGCFVIKYETVEGAKLAVSPEWHRIYKDVEAGKAQVIDTDLQLGDHTLVYLYRDRQPNGRYRVDYDVEFVYHNAIVVIVGRDWENEVDSDYVVNAARIVLEKLEAAPLVNP